MKNHRMLFSLILISAIGSVRAEDLLVDNFNYPDGLITNEYAFWNPEDPNSVKNPIWEMDSGSFFASGGAGWSGVPNDRAPNARSTNGNNSAVFRLNTKRSDFGDVAVSFSLLNQGLTPSPSTPPVDWDGLHIWLHYQSEYYLYYASINRRDNTVVIKKKVPGGPSNGGTYYELSDYVPHTVPYNTWQQIKATVQNNLDGSVTIKLFENDVLLVSATDNGTIAGPPIRGLGKVGLRGDNANLKFKNFVVSTLSGSTPATIPNAPTGLSASSGDRRATVQWSAVGGATSYNMYWSTSRGVNKSNGTRISGVTSPRTLSNLTNGTTCYAVVTAVNSMGESAESVQVQFTPAPVPTGVLPAPRGVSASSAESKITISWNPVPGATSYNLYRNRVTGVSKANGYKIANVTAPYVNKGLVNGQAYYLVVTAVNQAGESLESAEVAATPGSTSAPVPPTNIRTIPGDGQIVIKWDPVPGATSYNLYRSRASNVNKQTGYQIENVTNPSLNTGFANGKPIYMVVTAVNEMGESDESVMVSAIPYAGGPRGLGINGPGSLGASTSLETRRIFPNPWRNDKNAGNPVTFDQLTPGTSIRIFTLAGQWVNTLEAESATTWDLRNHEGEKVASGVYVCLFTNNNGEKKRSLLTVIQ